MEAIEEILILSASLVLVSLAIVFAVSWANQMNNANKINVLLEEIRTGITPSIGPNYITLLNSGSPLSLNLKITEFYFNSSTKKMDQINLTYLGTAIKTGINTFNLSEEFPTYASVSFYTLTGSQILTETLKAPPNYLMIKNIYSSTNIYINGIKYVTNQQSSEVFPLNSSNNRIIIESEYFFTNSTINANSTNQIFVITLPESLTSHELYVYLSNQIKPLPADNATIYINEIKQLSTNSTGAASFAYSGTIANITVCYQSCYNTNVSKFSGIINLTKTNLITLYKKSTVYSLILLYKNATSNIYTVFPGDLLFSSKMANYSVSVTNNNFAKLDIYDGIYNITATTQYNKSYTTVSNVLIQNTTYLCIPILPTNSKISNYKCPLSAFSNGVLHIIFDESGLKNGTVWNVMYNKTDQSSSLNNIIFYTFNKTANLPYSIPNLNINKTFYYSPNDSSGYAKAQQTINVSFITNYLTFFEETGLPKGTVWNVSFGGSFNSSTANSILFYNKKFAIYNFTIPNQTIYNRNSNYYTTYVPKLPLGKSQTGNIINVSFTKYVPHNIIITLFKNQTLYAGPTVKLLASIKPIVAPPYNYYWYEETPNSTIFNEIQVNSSDQSNQSVYNFETNNLNVPGNYSFYVNATNSSGIKGTSNIVKIDIKIPPRLFINPNPAVYGDNITITAKCPVSTDTCAIDYLNVNTPIATGTGTATYTYNSFSLGSGTYSYFYANDLTQNVNSTGQTLVVNKATPYLTLPNFPNNFTYNGNSATITANIITYNNQLTANYYINNGFISSFNTETIAQEAAAGEYVVVANTIGNENYTNATITKTLLISKNSTYTFEFTSIGSNSSYPGESQVTTGEISTHNNQLLASLYLNNNLIGNTSTTISQSENSVGTYDFKFTTLGNNNYTAKTIYNNYTITLYYVPINITNYQSISTQSNFQQIINITESSFSNYIAYNNNFANFEYSYANGTAIPAWIESNSSGKLITWAKIKPSIPANSKLTVYLDFASKTTNLLSSSGTSGIGEAPQLSSTYGEYDDGASVFDLYANFAGTSMPSGWTSNGKGVSQNNGLVVSYLGYVVTSNTYSPGSTVYEVYADFTPINTAPPKPNIDVGLTNGAGAILGWDANWNINGGTQTAAPVYSDSSYYSITIGSPPYTAASTGAYHVWYTDWLSSSNADFSVDYGSQISTTGLSGLPSSLPFGVDNTQDGGNDSTILVKWVRIRLYPPNGVMPSVTFGSVS